MLTWWLNFILTILSLISPYWIKIFLIGRHNVILEKLDIFLFNNSTWIAGFFAIMTLWTYFFNKKSERLFESVSSLRELRQIDWYEFELLVGETFRRAGFLVKQKGGPHADGGIDLEVYRKNTRIIVQCKHWKKSLVGVQVTREMYGVLMHEKAKKVYIVTCGKFTKEAQDFVKNKPIILIDGRELVNWMQELKDDE